MLRNRVTSQTLPILEPASEGDLDSEPTSTRPGKLGRTCGSRSAGHSRGWGDSGCPRTWVRRYRCRKYDLRGTTEHGSLWNRHLLLTTKAVGPHKKKRPSRRSCRLRTSNEEAVRRAATKVPSDAAERLWSSPVRSDHRLPVRTPAVAKSGYVNRIADFDGVAI